MLRLAEFPMRQKAGLIRRMHSTLKSRGPAHVSTLGYERLTSVDPTRIHRQQHQIAAVDDDHRAAMRLFVDALNTALVSPPFRQSAGSSVEPAPKNSSQEAIIEGDEAKSVAPCAENIDSANTTAIVEKQLSPPRSMHRDTRQTPNQTKDLIVSLGRAIKRKQTQTALTLFHQAIADKQLIDPTKVISLFYLVSNRDPVASHAIIRYYNLHPETADIRVDMYRRLCNVVSYLDPRLLSQRKMVRFVETLLTELDAMDEDIKRQLYPNLTASLVAQRSVSIGPYAGKLYKYMVANDFELAPGWLNKLLSSSKYNRQEDLPFHDVLARVVATGEFPHPLSTLPVIHNMFPYTDTAPICVALQGFLDIQTKSLEQNNEKVSALYKQYSIDRSTLEMISAGAAHSGDPELILLVWEVLEMAGYKPTEQIYENTVVAFACRRDGLHQAFAAVAAMKDEGFDVSRALIRSFSRAIRSRRRHVDNAFRLLTGGHEYDELRCLENFNVVLSSYAERGDVNESRRVLDVMRAYDFKPNQDSYAFAMEALGKDLHRRKSAKDKSWVHKNIEMAGYLLATMDEEGVMPSAEFVRNYVELLCLSNELGTATELIEDCLSTEEMKSIVSNKALYRVALANAEAGHMEVAKKLASLTSEEIPVLRRKIRSKEQRFNHLESMKKLREERREQPRTGEEEA